MEAGQRSERQAEEVQGALWALMRLYASRRAFARWSATSGVLISQPAFDLLGRIEERGSATLGQLGRLAHMDPSAVGRQVRLLEELGLVERGPDPGDRRVTTVGITPRGKEVRHRVADAGARHLRETLAAWPAADRAALARLLPRLAAELRARRYGPIGADEGAGDEADDEAAGDEAGGGTATNSGAGPGCGGGREGS